MTEETQTTEKLCRVLSIDAWRDGPGWTWNNWHHVADVPRAVLEYDKRKLLKYLRHDKELLSAESRGRVAIEDDDQYNIVIVDKNTREPLFAIEYGNLT